MEINMNDDELRKLAKTQAEAAKAMSRELFELFKATAFPQAKLDALDYSTVCRIEDEFRKQERMAEEMIDNAFGIFLDEMEQWKKRFEWMLNAYSRMVIHVMDSFIVATRGHDLTYWRHHDRLPAPLVIKLMEEGENAHEKMLLKRESSALRLRSVFAKRAKKVREEMLVIESEYEAKIKQFIEVDFPASNKKVETFILQNYLQRLGGEHGLN
jgi:hypothetical protein